MSDLNKMNREELLQLQKDVAKALKTLDECRRKEAFAAAETVAKDHGFNLNDLVGGSKPKKAVAAPKFAHPDNPSLTWSGRGRKPKWFVEALDAGKGEEDLLIG